MRITYIPERGEFFVSINNRPLSGKFRTKGEALLFVLALKSLVKTVLVQRSKGRTWVLDRLKCAQKKDPVPSQGIPKDIERAPLRLAVEIDQQVAARNKIKARKGRIFEQVL